MFFFSAKKNYGQTNSLLGQDEKLSKACKKQPQESRQYILTIRTNQVRIDIRAHTIRADPHTIRAVH